MLPEFLRSIDKYSLKALQQPHLELYSFCYVCTTICAYLYDYVTICLTQVRWAVHDIHKVRDEAEFTKLKVWVSIKSFYLDK